MAVEIEDPGQAAHKAVVAHAPVTDVEGTLACSATRIDVLDDIDRAHAAMQDAIDAARTEVVLSTYIFRTDRLSRGVTDALSRAHARGVRVRILMDGFANGLIWGFRRFVSGFRLRRLGFEVRHYNDSWLDALLPTRWKTIGQRYHRKICVVDAKIAFMGSQNIGWVRNLETHFRLEGQIADVLAGIFEADWNGEAYSAPTGPPDQGSIPVRLILTDPRRRGGSFRRHLKSQLSRATQRVQILTPYFLPDGEILDSLLAAHDRGVRVEILVPERSNYVYLDWASRHTLAPLVEAGCDIYFRPDLFDHSKLMVIDGKQTLIGTSNWDMRSLRHNFELDLMTRDPAFTRRIRERLQRKRSQSRRADADVWRSAPIGERIRNALAALLLPVL